MSAERLSFGTIAEAGNQRPASGDCLLDLGKPQRSLMALLAVPHLGDPECVRILRVRGDDVAQAARHGCGTFKQDRGELIALT